MLMVSKMKNHLKKKRTKLKFTKNKFCLKYYECIKYQWIVYREMEMIEQLQTKKNLYVEYKFRSSQKKPNSLRYNHRYKLNNLSVYDIH